MIIDYIRVHLPSVLSEANNRLKVFKSVVHYNHLSTKQRLLSVRLKKKPNCPASLPHLSKTKVPPSLMTMHKKHGLLAIHTKQSLWASA